MKLAIALTVILSGSSAMAACELCKPNGEEVFDILFNSIHLPLDKEPLCNMKSITRGGGSINLGQYLATTLSLSYATKNKVEIKSACGRSKHEADSQEIVEVWDCKVEIFETSQEGEFVSSAMIAFAVDLNKTNILAGSLRCF